MNDTFKILTCKAKGRAHQGTEVTINWDGMDEEHLKVLARSCIVQAMQMRWKKDPFASIPDKCAVNATEFVKGQLHEILIDRPPVPKQASWLDKMIAGMSEAEKASILAMMPNVE